LAIDQTEERMKAFLQDIDADERGPRRTDPALKEAAERGRRGIRG
jgi:hypothetical protein